MRAASHHRFSSFHLTTYQFYQFYINFLKLNNKESVILSTVDPAHAPVKQEEIKVVSVFTKLSRSLDSWRILNWLVGWGVEKGILTGVVRMVLWTNKEVEQRGEEWLNRRKRLLAEIVVIFLWASGVVKN